MPPKATVAVVGTGGLASAICYALAASPHPLHVLVLGRDGRRTAEISYIGAARAIGTEVTFQPLTVDLAVNGALARTLDQTRPDGVVVAASPQSPWERRTAPSAWTALVERAGYGLTLPLQAQFVLEASRFLAAEHSSAWLINGCLPDAVNPVLARLGTAPICGIGNSHLITTSAQAALGIPEPGRLHILAHHLHLHPPAAGVEEALIWADGVPLTDVGGLLAPQRATSRAELNHVTGHAAALVIADLAADHPVESNLPGPLGLPGGYPVTVIPPTPAGPARVELRLPKGMSLAKAVAFNERVSVHDGVTVTDGRVVFTRVSPGDLPAELADGFSVDDLDDVIRHMHQLRDRLREKSP
ncbi:hypothetical protein AB0I72_26440 [Nocardiopsis sp. NPDC049922]|uniref:hypothetical protein n=1 Tax=Nocardiopsis sp. NPDC049922 TaxID=3155157 RepID=UPI0034072387